MTPHELFQSNKTRYQSVIAMIVQLNEIVRQCGRTLIGHDIDHDLMVGQIAALVSESVRDQEMAFVAGLLHSRDRHHGKHAPGIIDGMMQLPTISRNFRGSELALIREAIKRDSEFKNNPEDSAVLKALKDGDKLANCGPVNLFRCALHNFDKPAFILEDMSTERPSPGSTFKNPQSCFDALFFNEEWRSKLQMPKAIKMGQKWFDYLQQHQRDIVAQLTEVGLLPWE